LEEDFFFFFFFFSKKRVSFFCLLIFSPLSSSSSSSLLSLSSSSLSLTVRHIFNNGLLAGDVLEPDGVTHLVPQLAAHLRRDARGDAHGSDAAGLRAADAPRRDRHQAREGVDSRRGRGAARSNSTATFLGGASEPFLVQKLRQLRRLARARFSHDDRHLVLPDQRHQLVAAGSHG
jgi:hypothetical protein